ncbi:MAG: hypothetical protein ABI333_22105 [bacterium]
MSEDKSAHPVKVMDADVSTKDAAREWLGKRIRQLFKLAILSVILTPVAVVIVILGKTVFRGRGMPPMGDLAVVTLMWCAIVIPILLFVVVLLGIKRFKIARRVRPILDGGTQRQGQVEDVQHGSSRKSGVNFYSVTITVALADGGRVTAAIVESEGTELPLVEQGASAVVWTLGEQSVVGTSGSLFESSVQV